MASSVESKLSGFNDIALLVGRILIGGAVHHGGLRQVQGTDRHDRVFHQARHSGAVDCGAPSHGGVRTRCRHSSCSPASRPALSHLRSRLFVVIAALFAHTNLADEQPAQSLHEEPCDRGRMSCAVRDRRGCVLDGCEDRPALVLGRDADLQPIVTAPMRAPSSDGNKLRA